MEPLIDQLIRTSFPHPVAAAWHRVTLATSSADRTKRLLACLEVLVRVQCAVLLPDYLRGEPDDAVEKTLERLDRPALGHWVQLLRSLVRALEARSLPPFLPEAVAWYLTKGRPSDAAKRLDALVEVRNDEAHGRALSIGEQDQRAGEVLAELRTVLSEMSFLARYRAFRVLQSSLARSGGFTGRVQFLIGTAPQAEPIRATWPSRLFEESVYLTNPAGTEVLEISPFLAVVHDPGPKEDRVFVFAGTLKQKKLILKNDGTGATETVMVASEDGDLPFDAWLAARAEHRPWQTNQGASEIFGALEKSSVGELLAGRFEVRDQLGQGGMATVFRVWDQWDEAEFALKVLHRQLADDASFKERFRREARTMKRLRHPHILLVDEAGQLEDGRLYLKLPILTGGTLQDRVKAGASPPEAVQRWAIQLVSALEYLHERGVIHRDLKPSNFLLDQHGDCFLSDFGIAVQGDEIRLTRTLEQMGSVAYMSPEQRRGGDAGPPSDVYSLGVVLHELLTGREGDPTPGKGLQGPLGELVRWMCTEDPAERPTAPEVLRRIRPPEPTPAPAPVVVVEAQAPSESLAFTSTEVPAGTFAMGSDRQVTLTRPVWVSGPISRSDWALVVGPAPGDGAGPVRGVSWYDAVGFCVAASTRAGLAPAYRLAEPRPRKVYGIDDIGRMLREVVPFKRVPAILAHFGTEALTVLQFAPERLAEVAGIGEKSAAEYGRKWDRAKYFVRDVSWDRSAPGYRLPTEAEWVHAVHEPDVGLEWVWCADPSPAWLTGAGPLEAGEVVDPATDEGPRRIVRGPGLRRAAFPDAIQPPVGLRVVRWA